MNHDDPELLRRIMDDDPARPASVNPLHAALVRKFEGRRKKVLVRASLWILCAMLMFLGGVWMVIIAATTKPMLIGVVLILTGFEMNVLVKLWFWVVDSKLSMLKELKLLRLTLDQREPQEALSEAQALGEAERVWERMSLRTTRRIFGGIVLLVAILGAIVGVMAVNPALRSRLALPFLGMGIRAEQEDTWHIVSPEAADITSVIALSSWPKGRGKLNIKLPYAQGELESVTSNVSSGELAWEARGSGRFEVTLPPRFSIWEKPRVTVRWKLPLSALDTGDGLYRAWLMPLTPANAYSLNVVIDPGVEMKFRDYPDAREFTAFHGQFSSPQTCVGSCGIGIAAPTQNPEKLP
jgi:hypothetical protein